MEANFIAIKPGTSSLHEMAQEYANYNFPMPKHTPGSYTSAEGSNAVKNDIAFHSYCAGFNAALRCLMAMRNLTDPCQHHGDDPNLDYLIEP